jgi:hypothetical protein
MRERCTEDAQNIAIHVVLGGAEEKQTTNHPTESGPTGVLSADDSKVVGVSRAATGRPCRRCGSISRLNHGFTGNSTSGSLRGPTIPD